MESDEAALSDKLRKVNAFSLMMDGSTAAERRLSRPKKKGSEDYQAQANFRGDWKLYNAIIDLLSSNGLGFRKGVEETAGRQLVSALTDVLFVVLPEERLERRPLSSFARLLLAVGRSWIQ